MYRVEWMDDALDGLALAWTQAQAADRVAITAAQVALDRLLALNPLGHGKHVSEGLYAIEVPPLRVQYEIAEDQGLVTVVSVRRLP